MKRYIVYRRPQLFFWLIIAQLNVYSRSNITITDESKLGTTLDEQKFNNETRALTAHKHLIKLGNYEQILRYACYVF